jgi:hypothetical protein
MCVSLESVWHLHQQGASPADIVRAFDTLQLADVYAVLAWALRHSEDVDAYLKRRESVGRPDQAPAGGSQAHAQPRGERPVEGKADGAAAGAATARNRRRYVY